MTLASRPPFNKHRPDARHTWWFTRFQGRFEMRIRACGVQRKLAAREIEEKEGDSCLARDLLATRSPVVLAPEGGGMPASVRQPRGAVYTSITGVIALRRAVEQFGFGDFGATSSLIVAHACATPKTSSAPR